MLLAQQESVMVRCKTKTQWQRQHQQISCTKKQLAEFAEDQIDIYSINEFNVQSAGLFIQVKGWGNLKDLSVLNALKNSIAKFPSANGIIYNYSLSSMTAIIDGGWECKVKVTPGKIVR